MFESTPSVAKPRRALGVVLLHQTRDARRLGKTRRGLEATLELVVRPGVPHDARLGRVRGGEFGAFGDARGGVVGGRRSPASNVAADFTRPDQRVRGRVAVSAARARAWRRVASSWRRDARAARWVSSSFASFHREGARCS